jgi:hypothetical protein
LLIAEHPAAPGIPYGQEGRAATVYRLTTQGNSSVGYALKVFKPNYRVPALVALTQRLSPFATLPGLAVCRRSVLSPLRHAGLLRQHPDLTYAVLMPWVAGPTWTDVLVQGQLLRPEESLTLARGLAEVCVGMEEQGVAHCDLSGPNVLLPSRAVAGTGAGPGRETVALVDVEQLYGPGLDRPNALPAGSPGYAHRAAASGMWEAGADRFAGAVLLAEMLGWCSADVRAATWSESYFAPDDLQRPGRRYDLLREVLAGTWGQPVAELLDRAWASRNIQECPTLGEWLVALPQRAPTATSRAQLRTQTGSTATSTAASTATSPPNASVQPAQNEPYGMAAPESNAPVSRATLAMWFDTVLVALEEGRGATAARFLNGIIRRDPDYSQDGHRADDLLRHLIAGTQPSGRTFRTGTSTGPSSPRQPGAPSVSSSGAPSTTARGNRGTTTIDPLSQRHEPEGKGTGRVWLIAFAVMAAPIIILAWILVANLYHPTDSQQGPELAGSRTATIQPTTSSVSTAPRPSSTLSPNYQTTPIATPLALEANHSLPPGFELSRNLDGTSKTLAKLVLRASPDCSGYVLIMNSSKLPFNDARVRAAVDYGLPYSNFQTQFIGFRFEPRSDLSRKLVKEAGYLNGFSAKAQTEWRGSTLSLANSVISSLREVGIQLTQVPSPDKDARNPEDVGIYYTDPSC